MKRTTLIRIAATAAAVFLSGCATVLPDDKHAIEAREQVSRVDRHGAFPAVRRIYFEQVNLVELIDPQQHAPQKYKGLWDETHNYPDERKWGARYDLVLAWFRESAFSDEEKRMHRNGVQDRILAVSTSRCNVFKTYLRRQQSDVNYSLGAATTAAGVLGAVLGGVNASRNLAGAAGLFSGLQAEYNQSYYNNLTAHVIVQGIELLQSRLQKQLIEARAQHSIATYTMEAAINDAIYIDGTCSTVSGLIEAAESIKQVSNPGLVFAGQVIASTRALREIEQADFNELMKTGKLEELLKKAAPAGPPLIAALNKGEASAAVTASASTAAGAQAQAVARTYATALKVGTQFLESQRALPANRKLKEDADIERRSAELRDLFKKHANGAVAKLNFPACVDKLKAPAQAVSTALLDQASAGSDEAKRVKAANDLAVARANMAAAVARVDILSNAVIAGLDANAKRWEAISKTDGPVDADFAKVFQESDFQVAALGGLCP